MKNKISDQILKYNVIFQEEPKGGYTVIVPTLRGCVTYGKTLEEARAMALDAIQGFISCMQDDGEEIPTDEKSFMSTIDLSFPKLQFNA
jgi:antitoxin HicB